MALLDFAMAVYDSDLSCVTGGARGKLMYRAPEATSEDAVFDARQAAAWPRCLESLVGLRTCSPAALLGSSKHSSLAPGQLPRRTSF